MSVGGGGGGRGFRGVDEAAQRRLNAEAPQIKDLGKRIVALFRPYLGKIVVTGLIVVLGAAIAVVPPLIVQRASTTRCSRSMAGPTWVCSSASWWP
ncbi:hypothetical protein [Tessaracoccus flavescens]|uniref:hypothetical protein n=1 Tax=Tessaracoccus flavescens TaxID=399497 RepID=UPI0019310F79|nr:hypothetical protein [Tessaracoccus flavescens]